MPTPFETLGVSEDADDAAIKKAYLARVREFPPEREPERFQAVRAAYEAIRGPRERLAWRLFQTLTPDPAPLLAAWLGQGGLCRPDIQLVLRVLEAGVKGPPPTT
jgi:hypothetical protein